MVGDDEGHIAVFALAGGSGEQFDERLVSGHEVVDTFLDSVERSEVDVPLGPRLELGDGLGSAQQHDRHDRQLLFVDAEGVRGTVEVLEGAAAGLSSESGQVEVVQLSKDPLYVGVGEGRDRLPVVLLLAGGDQGIDGHRVVVGRRHLLLDERPQHPRLFVRQLHSHRTLSLPNLALSSTTNVVSNPGLLTARSVDLDATFR